ncbi:uroporphyrinogen-III synthase [Nonlabens tegetincola]|uniref:uroporphyrinogen-III synthase n=1 Tax=Nonlabens tegetincola TaxID=323273 RepID=UPI0005AB10A8|nr:uroporphyrinogen-III synthase [Nonlabens tegetincola]
MKSRILSLKSLSNEHKNQLLDVFDNVVDLEPLKKIQLSPRVSLRNNHIIITSQNAIPFLKKNYDSQLVSCYCVGINTSSLLQENGYNVIVTHHNAKELAHHICAHYHNTKFDYLTSPHRRNELPDTLTDNKISYNEIYVYDTIMVKKSFSCTFDVVLCYSPRGVYAFAKANSTNTSTAICIGETTATAARNFFKTVIVAEEPSVAHVIKTVLKTYKND